MSIYVWLLSYASVYDANATNSENYSNEMGDKFKQFSHSSGGVNATRERGRVNAAPPVRP